MKKSFQSVVNRVIADADIVIEVLDARIIQLTRHQELEQRILRSKRLIHCITKCDLVDEVDTKGLENPVFVSSTKRYGSKKLRDMIYKVAAKDKKEQIVVGIIGYPNVGKSSVINLLKGKTSAAVAPRAGKTRGVQKIRISSRVVLLDTPGVIPFAQTDSAKLALLGSKNPDQVKDIDLAAGYILEAMDKAGKQDIIKARYKCEEVSLESIALSANRLKKGGEPDIITISRIIVTDWQQGRLS